ncbi:hypothetical protein AQUCO_24000001v1 [Aquilegia coerulea]|uniref:non-specific serine/threonine protein kinase n=1 Tax=Aquilegia coerulea TaxID=218851 RepID=A0A2G5C0J4_AQUCA|nr:hypothetical protein AQUCO_24000001v1 [Aquilegia coerulea]
MELPSHAISTLISFNQMIWLFCLICMLLLSSFKSGSAVALVSPSSRKESDSFALLAIKSQIPHDPLGVLKSWNHSLHHCDWQGIKCSRRHRERVTVLDLGHKELEGTLSPYIGNLSFLRNITLTKNNFHGEIPQEIGRLFRLQHLVLNNNSFQGEIPSNITYCSDLKQINLVDNKLSGRIFAGFSSLSKLEALGLGKNKFIGKIPQSLGNLTSLIVLSLYGNHLEGNIPDDVCNIRSLGFFQVGQNNLTGNIPSCLFNHSSIHTFGVYENQLEGTLPPNIGHTLPNLKAIYLGGNKFSGLIPVSLSNATRLEHISISSNAFTGSIPRDLGKLQGVRRLEFGYNQIGTQGGDDLNIINSLTNCSKLEFLDFSGNVLKGPLPDSISNLSTTIKFLSFANNTVYGSIPIGIGNLVNIEEIRFALNNLTGAIPTSIGKLNQLRNLYLQTNLLSGHIPSSMGNLTQLTILSLESNNFNGSIPSTLGNCQNLASLSLSENNFVGAIPIQVISISSLTIGLFLDQNSLTGSLPLEVESLGKCLNLNNLFMNGNFFEGEIPKSLNTLRGLKNLDISRNNLSGEIPEYLEQFLDLGYLNLSFNQLEGWVPRNGVFANASLVSVDGNHNLCGGIEELKLQPCVQEETKKKTSLSFKVIIPIIVGSSFGFEFMPCGSLEEWLHPRLNGQQHDSKNLSFIQRLNIAIDVASALEYLHHRCQPGVVHCDLKPSNVLLDDDMTARVADFGIAKLFSAVSYESAQSQPSSEVIRGSIGYVAPEYGMGVKVSMQGDVYSYGILLLEMFTRKRPTDDMFLNGLSLHNYAEMALSNQVMGIIDPLLLLEHNIEVVSSVEQSNTGGRLEECLVSAITVGLTCSTEAPAERMTMGDVVSELLHIKKHYQNYSKSIFE